MTRERMSRPSSSVPNQWTALGGCSLMGRSSSAGSLGAIHGANRAKKMKMATNTIPAAASRFRRPRVVAAVQVVDRAILLPKMPKFVIAKINILLSHSRSLLRFLCRHNQIVGHRKYSWDFVGANVGQVFVHSAVHYA